MRIGIGYDAHRLEYGRKLVLGGVEIPYEKGLLGVSDADVLLHAITDALLGAAALGDIGMHFPPSDEKYRGISSILLLKKAYELIQKSNLTVGNIDCVVIAEKPHLSKYIPQMRVNISEALCMDVSAISVKATTTEGMGFEGRGEGISAKAVCVLE